VLLAVLSDAPPASAAARTIVETLRRERTIGDGTLLVAGATAHDMDITAFIRAGAPRAIAFTVLMTYLVLFVLLRSVLLPLKAVVMNLLSIAASFGALVWIFQDGHLASLLAFEPAPLIRPRPCCSLPCSASRWITGADAGAMKEEYAHRRQ
jgi:RND superfamily putative drug exporter